jgi:hypothetical protein
LKLAETEIKNGQKCDQRKFEHSINFKRNRYCNPQVKKKGLEKCLKELKHQISLSINLKSN